MRIDSTTGCASACDPRSAVRRLWPHSSDRYTDSMRASVLTLALSALLATTPTWAQDAAPAISPVTPPPAAATEDALPAPLPPAGDQPSASPPAEAAALSLAAQDTPPPPEPADTAPTSDVPTQAEADFDALYGPQTDGTGDAPTATGGGGTYDPWERYNRPMHRFNNAVDRTVARPLARGYVKVVPRPMRLGVSNFFSNLGQPVSAVNALLQGKPTQAAHSLGRFVLNSTLGIVGIFDPATDAHLQNRSEDFGQTLGVWGWKRSRYVELPLFGPRTLRDVVGMAGDAPLSPLRGVEADRTRIPLQGLQLVDIRSQLLATDALREGAADDYALLRDAWSQRRHYQIFGDRPGKDDTQLPDYMLDENLPNVPVDAMPVLPPDGP